MIQASDPIRSMVGKKYEQCKVYRLYLERLLSWRQRHDQKNIMRDTGILHVIGERHALSVHGMVVCYNGHRLRCFANRITGCKQWHLGKNQENCYKYQFEAIMKRLPRESNIFLTIGEIDCRHDEGILKAWDKSPDLQLDEMAHITTSAYLSYVAKIADYHRHKIIVSGVPCTNIPLNTLTTTAAENIVHLIKTFNLNLKDITSTFGLDFLDVHALTDRGDGIATGEWHIDEHHLLPSAVVEAFARHRCSS